MPITIKQQRVTKNDNLQQTRDTSFRLTNSTDYRVQDFTSNLPNPNKLAKQQQVEQNRLQTQLANQEKRIYAATGEKYDNRNWLQKLSGVEKHDNLFTSTMKLLQRPLQFVKAGTQTITSPNNGTIFNALKTTLEGKNDDLTWTQSLGLDGGSMNPFTSFMANMGLDIALDPLNFIPAGTIAGVFSKIKNSEILKNISNGVAKTVLGEQGAAALSVSLRQLGNNVRSKFVPLAGVDEKTKDVIRGMENITPETEAEVFHQLDAVMSGLQNDAKEWHKFILTRNIPDENTFLVKSIMHKNGLSKEQAIKEVRLTMEDMGYVDFGEHLRSFMKQKGYTNRAKVLEKDLGELVKSDTRLRRELELFLQSRGDIAHALEQMDFRNEDEIIDYFMSQKSLVQQFLPPELGGKRVQPTDLATVTSRYMEYVFNQNSKSRGEMSKMSIAKGLGMAASDNGWRLAIDATNKEAQDELLEGIASYFDTNVNAFVSRSTKFIPVTTESAKIEPQILRDIDQKTTKLSQQTEQVVQKTQAVSSPKATDAVLPDALTIQKVNREIEQNIEELKKLGNLELPEWINTERYKQMSLEQKEAFNAFSQALINLDEVQKDFPSKTANDLADFFKRFDKTLQSSMFASILDSKLDVKKALLAEMTKEDGELLAKEYAKLNEIKSVLEESQPWEQYNKELSQYNSTVSKIKKEVFDGVRNGEYDADRVLKALENYGVPENQLSYFKKFIVNNNEEIQKTLLFDAEKYLGITNSAIYEHVYNPEFKNFQDLVKRMQNHNNTLINWNEIASGNKINAQEYGYVKDIVNDLADYAKVYKEPEVAAQMFQIQGIDTKSILEFTPQAREYSNFWVNQVFNNLESIKYQGIPDALKSSGQKAAIDLINKGDIGQFNRATMLKMATDGNDIAYDALKRYSKQKLTKEKLTKISEEVNQELLEFAKNHDYNTQVKDLLKSKSLVNQFLKENPQSSLAKFLDGWNLNTMRKDIINAAGKNIYLPQSYSQVRSLRPDSAKNNELLNAFSEKAKTLDGLVRLSESFVEQDWVENELRALSTTSTNKQVQKNLSSPEDISRVRSVINSTDDKKRTSAVLFNALANENESLVNRLNEASRSRRISEQKYRTSKEFLDAEKQKNLINYEKIRNSQIKIGVANSKRVESIDMAKKYYHSKIKELKEDTRIQNNPALKRKLAHLSDPEYMQNFDNFLDAKKSVINASNLNNRFLGVPDTRVDLFPKGELEAANDATKIDKEAIYQQEQATRARVTRQSAEIKEDKTTYNVEGERKTMRQLAEDNERYMIDMTQQGFQPVDGAKILIEPTNYASQLDAINKTQLAAEKLKKENPAAFYSHGYQDISNQNTVLRNAGTNGITIRIPGANKWERQHNLQELEQQFRIKVADNLRDSRIAEDYKKEYRAANPHLSEETFERQWNERWQAARDRSVNVRSEIAQGTSDEIVTKMQNEISLMIDRVMSGDESFERMFLSERPNKYVDGRGNIFVPRSFERTFEESKGYSSEGYVNSLLAVNDIITRYIDRLGLNPSIFTESGYMKSITNPQQVLFEALYNINEPDQHSLMLTLMTTREGAKLKGSTGAQFHWLKNVYTPETMNQILGLGLYKNDVAASTAQMLRTLPEDLKMLNIVKSGLDSGSIKVLKNTPENTAHIVALNSGAVKNQTFMRADDMWDKYQKLSIFLPPEQVNQWNEAFAPLFGSGLGLSFDELKGMSSGEIAKLTKNSTNLVEMPIGLKDVLTRESDPTKRFGKLSNFLSFITSKWKKITLATPGYHIRNILGNVFNANTVGIPMGEYTAEYLKSMDKINEYQKNMKDIAGILNNGGDKVRTMNDAKNYIIKYRGQAAWDNFAEYNNFVKNGVLGQARISSDEWRTLSEMADISKKQGWTSQQLRNVFNANHGMGQMFDEAARLATYNIGLREPKYIKQIGGEYVSKEAAANALVRYTHFDFNAMTNFERDTMRKVFPFYTWTKKNLEFQFKALIYKPQSATKYAKFLRNWNESQDINPEEEPDWILDQMWIPIRKGENAYFVKVGAPIQDMVEISNLELLSRLNPLWKIGIESLTGHSTFGDQETNFWKSAKSNLLNPIKNFMLKPFDIPVGALPLGNGKQLGDVFGDHIDTMQKNSIWYTQNIDKMKASRAWQEINERAQFIKTLQQRGIYVPTSKELADAGKAPDNLWPKFQLPPSKLETHRYERVIRR